MVEGTTEGRKEDEALPPLDVCCPTCGAPQGGRCKTMTTARTTDIHHERHSASYRRRCHLATEQRREALS